MNQIIAKVGATVVTVAVILFAVCMLIPFDFGSYFICMLLATGYVIMAAGFYSEAITIIRSQLQQESFLLQYMR